VLITTAFAFFALDRFDWNAQMESAESATTVQQAIAVLPFVSTSADYEQVFFCDNLAAGSLNLLARVHQ